MKTRFILSGTFVCVIAFVLVSRTTGLEKAEPPSHEPAQPLHRPRATFDTLVQDVGEIRQGVKVERQFQLSNTGDDTLFVKTIDGGCACMAGLAGANVVQPGGSTTLAVQLDTALLEGEVNKSIIVSTNDPSAPTKELLLKAVVVPDFRFSAPVIDLGDIAPGSTRLQPVVITATRVGPSVRQVWAADDRIVIVGQREIRRAPQILEFSVGIATTAIPGSAIRTNISLRAIDSTIVDRRLPIRAFVRKMVVRSNLLDKPPTAAK